MIFSGMGTNPKVCFFGWHKREKFGFFQNKKVGFLFNFSRNYFFGGVGWGGWKKGVHIYNFCLFFFCDMVT